MASKKHLYKGEDLDKVIKAYEEVRSTSVYDFNTRSNGYSHCGVDFPLKEEFKVLKTMMLLVFKMYELNDFTASSYCYLHLVKMSRDWIAQINDLLLRTKETKENEEKIETIKKTIMFKGKITRVTLPDSTTRDCSMIEYVHTHIHFKAMSISARWFIRDNIQYLERDKLSKDYPTRARILESALWWANQMLLGRFDLKMPNRQEKYGFTPTELVFCTFPSSGKSYLCNTFNAMFVELSMIVYNNGGVLRVGNEQGNIFRQSKQTMNLLMNPLIFDVYPENIDFISKKTEKYDPFDKSSEEEWGLKNCLFDPATCVFKTRDSAINSVRCRVGMFDDPSRGQAECNNVQIHKQITNVFNGDFKDRFKSQQDKCILLTGTMFNPSDVFSTEIQFVMDMGVEEDEDMLNTFISKNKQYVIILNDCENEYGESAFPEFIDTPTLMEKKAKLDLYDYSCIWRQKPIPPEGMIFAKETLNFYSTLDGLKLSPYAYTYIDPTRKKNSDYFSMPIFRYCMDDNKYYLVDIIFEQKSTTDLYDTIINKVEQNKIIKLMYEENIDVSMGTLLNEKAKAKGINYLEVSTNYANVPKMQRILDMANSIKSNIMFPSFDKLSNRSQMFVALNQLVEFNGEKNEHDDMADSLAGFTTNFIVKVRNSNKLEMFKRLPF